MYKEIEQYSKGEVKQAAFDYVTELLHKQPMSIVAAELLLYVPTVHRIINDELPVEEIKYLTAVHIIGMCEYNTRIKKLLKNAPSNRAYYDRRLERLEHRETQKQEAK